MSTLPATSAELQRDAAEARRSGVAVIGMACMFPGAPDLDSYWRNILGKVDAISDPPPGSWDPAIYYDPTGIDSDKVYCKRGGYLGSPMAFDPLPLGIPPVAVGGEPDQWLALKLARDAMLDAGCLNLPEEVRRRTAVILGKGTYLNGGNALIIEHGIVIGQTLRIIKQLNPEMTDEQIELLRREMKRALPQVGPETVPGLIPNISVGRIANRLDLMGPTYTIDAACASSLVAVQLALRDLQGNACDLALVGGAQVWMPVPILNIFCQLGALSHREQIRPFDIDADGTLLGEGIGMVVLKRLADAERDGDRIYAVIRGVGIASDGRGMSVMAPRIDGEELALRRAYESAGVSPETIELIEAHGTATPVGDVVELQALSRVFGPCEDQLPRCALGTVKSMISHTIPAAGIAGLIKTSLALYHQVLPPTLNVKQPNPKLELEKTPFYLNTETRPWVHGRPEPRRAGINAFGFGGINAHLILEEYQPIQGLSTDETAPSGTGAAARDHLPPWDSEVFILEAGSVTGLCERVERLAAYVDGVLLSTDTDVDPIALTDLAYSLNTALSQAEGRFRLAIVASSFDDLRTKLGRAATRLAAPNCRRIKEVSGIYFTAEPLGARGKLAFMFPGEGSQYPNMLADLCLHFPEVQACFDRSDRFYVDHPRGYVLSDVVFPRPTFSADERAWADAQLMRMDGAVEAVLTANQAMLALIGRLKLRPDAIVGHSTGEYSAMYAAGILALETDEQLARFSRALNHYYEHALAEDGVPKAVLLALATDRAQAQAIADEAGGDIALAMDNCPHQAVLVGGEAAAERALEIIRRQGLIYERLSFDRAYHTPLFAPYAEYLRDVMAETPIQPARIPAYSCTSAAPYPSDPDAIRALSVEHWATPVEFRRTVERLYADGVRIFVEVGARGNLTTFVEDILRGQDHSAIPANVQRRSGVTQLNHLVARLACDGVAMDLAELYSARRPRRLDWESEPAAPAKSPSAASVSLSTSWPTMRLPEDIVARLHERGAQSGAPASGQVASLTAAGPMTEAPASVVEPSAVIDGDGIDSAFAIDDEVSEPHAGDAKGVDDPSANPVGEMARPWLEEAETEAAMASYLQTMEQFLSVQTDVMHTYLTGGTPESPSPRAIEAIWAQAQAETALPDVERYPLLGRVMAWTPGESIVCERLFDVADDRYLRDHAFGHAVSSVDVDLTALVVMPLTMSLEIMAEAASALIPERGVVGLRDARAYRWLAWHDQPQLLRVSAKRLEPDGPVERVAVEIRNLTEDAGLTEPPRNPVIEAVVLLADAYPEPPSTLLSVPENASPAPWQPEQLYRDVMFHGLLWQCVAAIDQTSPAGSQAMLQVLPTDRLIRGVPEPRFVLDPVILDGAGQVVGFWTVEHLSEGIVIFPIRIAALDLFAGSPAAGAQVTCLTAVKEVTHQRVRADIDLIGPDGRAWMRLTDWEDKRFHVPPEFDPLLVVSRYDDVSVDWTEPIAAFPNEPGLRCRYARAHFPWDPGFWKLVWAYRMLSRAERELFRRLTIPEGRQIEWLAARTAAKDAVRDLLTTHYDLHLEPADIEISEDEHGKPVVGGAWTGLVDSVPAISLSHAHGHAAALAFLGSAADTAAPPRIGIDLERLRDLPDGFELTAFDEDERALLAGLPSDQRLEWTFRCWCAKEAVSKALGRGMIEGPRSVSAVGIDLGQSLVAVRLNGELARLFPEVAAAHVLAQTCRDGELVAAVTLCAPTRAWLAEGAGDE